MLHPPSRSRSLLHQRGSTLYGLEDPSLLHSPLSSLCGSLSRNMMSLAQELFTANASKPTSDTFVLLTCPYNLNIVNYFKINLLIQHFYNCIIIHLSSEFVLLHQRGSTLYGLVDPSLPHSPPSRPCGYPSRNMMSLAQELSTGNASKYLT